MEGPKKMKISEIEAVLKDETKSVVMAPNGEISITESGGWNGTLYETLTTGGHRMFNAGFAQGASSRDARWNKLKDELLEAEDEYAAVENWVGYETIKAVRMKMIELETKEG